MAIQYDLPYADQLEISLFGPGYGECIAVHYGNGYWFTVDSCLDDDKETPSALAYFRHLGIDLQHVTHTVVTHFHGDHVGGISSLFTACHSSQLVCPTIFHHREVAAYIAYFAQTDPSPLAQSTRELLELIISCGQRERPRNTPLYVSQDRPFIDNLGVRVTGLAPSDDKIHKFLKLISKQIPQGKMDRRAAGSLRPNDVSVACLIERGGFSCILGADLEEKPGKGWTTILESSIAFKRAAAAKVFKVAHHGSTNADCPALWAKMDKPLAILSPCKRGNIELPTSTDTDRILSAAQSAYCTSSFSTVQTKKLARVDKALRRNGIRNRDLYPKNGHIRVRIDANNEITVDLFKQAVPLSKVYG